MDERLDLRRLFAPPESVSASPPDRFRVLTSAGEQ